MPITKFAIKLSKKRIIEGKNTGMLALFDELYREISKENFANEEEKFKSLRDQISVYMGGPSAPRGSSRMVFPLDAGRVIKLALNEAGFAQNGMEATIGMDDSVGDIIAPVVATSEIMDYDGFLWIASKKIQPLSDDLAGKNWSEFATALRKAATTNDSVAMNKPAHSSVTDPDATKVEIPKAAADKRKAGSEEQVKRNQVAGLLKNVDENFFESFRKFVNKYKGARTADLFKPDSWGIDGDRLKLIDYGYTKRISEDFYVSGRAGGSDMAKQSIVKRGQERLKNIETTIADNIDTIENVKRIPPMATLLLLIRGVVAGLPLSIETFTIGNPLPPLSQTELAAAASAIRANQGKVERIIDQVTDPGLKNKLYDELDEVLLSTGSLGKTTRSEGLIRQFIKACLRG